MPITHVILRARAVTAMVLHQIFVVTHPAKHAGVLVALYVQNALLGISYNHHPQPARIRVPQVIGEIPLPRLAMLVILIAQPVLEPPVLNAVHVKLVTSNSRLPMQTLVPQPVLQDIIKIPVPIHAAHVTWHARHVQVQQILFAQPVMLATFYNHHPQPA